MLKKEFWTCWKEEWVLTSRPGLHESSTFLSMPSRQPFTSRQPCNFVKESQLFSFEQFSYFRHNFVYWHPKFCLLTSKLGDSSWFGKITQSTTTFMKKHSWDKVVWMDENTLKHTAYAWMVTLGIVWCLSEFLSIN